MAIGAISVTLGVVGFLITTVFTTVTKVEEKTREYKEFKDRVRAHKRSLIASQLELCSWNKTWSGHPDAVYEHLWGLDGIHEVETRAIEISRLARDIENTMNLQSAMNPTEWRSLVQTLGSDIYRCGSIVLSDEKQSVLRKLAFLLYTNNSLQEKTGRLKAMTTQLSDYTHSLLRLGQYPYVTKAPDRAEIENFARLKWFVDSVSEIGRELHEATEEESNILRWALALRTPDKDGDPELWAGVNDITCQFCVRLRTSRNEWIRFVIKIRHFFDVSVDKTKLKSEVVDAIITDMKAGLEYTNSPKAFSYGHVPTGQPRSLKSYLRQSTLTGRSTSSYYHHKKLHIALGLANWIILYWNTHWTDSPCSCKIRILKYEDEGDQPILYRRRQDGSGCQHHSEQECQTGEKLLLLGVTLAEIGLLVPISLDRQGPGINGLRFIRGSEIISLERLQGEIKDVVGFNGLPRAIQFCFTTWPHLTTFGPQLIKLFTEEVLSP